MMWHTGECLRGSNKKGDPEMSYTTDDLITAVTDRGGWCVNYTTAPPLVEYFAYTGYGELKITDSKLQAYIMHSAATEHLSSGYDLTVAIAWIEQGCGDPRESFELIQSS